MQKTYNSFGDAVKNKINFSGPIEREIFTDKLPPKISPIKDEANFPNLESSSLSPDRQKTSTPNKSSPATVKSPKKLNPDCNTKSMDTGSMDWLGIDMNKPETDKGNSEEKLPQSDKSSTDGDKFLEPLVVILVGISYHHPLTVTWKTNPLIV